jgi:glycerol dehydrogenase
MAGAKPTKAAFGLSRICYDTLLKDGLKAKIAASNKVFYRGS